MKGDVTYERFRNPVERAKVFKHPAGNVMAELNKLAAGAGEPRNSGGIACNLTDECNIGTHIKFCCYD